MSSKVALDRQCIIHATKLAGAKKLASVQIPFAWAPVTKPGSGAPPPPPASADQTPLLARLMSAGGASLCSGRRDADDYRRSRPTRSEAQNETLHAMPNALEIQRLVLTSFH